MSLALSSANDESLADVLHSDAAISLKTTKLAHVYAAAELRQDEAKVPLNVKDVAHFGPRWPTVSDQGFP